MYIHLVTVSSVRKLKVIMNSIFYSNTYQIFRLGIVLVDVSDALSIKRGK